MNAHKMKLHGIAAALFAVTAVTGILPASAVESGLAAKPVKLLGEPASPENADRTINIFPGTKYVNVTAGETVRFIMGEKIFAWHFDGPFSSFKLNQLVSEKLLDHVVTVYVAPNPLYFGM